MRLSSRRRSSCVSCGSYAKTGRARAHEEAAYVEEVVTNMEGISKNKASLAEYRYKFGITRPVPIIVNGRLRLTVKVSYNDRGGNHGASPTLL